MRFFVNFLLHTAGVFFYFLEKKYAKRFIIGEYAALSPFVRKERLWANIPVINKIPALSQPTGVFIYSRWLNRANNLKSSGLAFVKFKFQNFAKISKSIPKKKKKKSKEKNSPRINRREFWAAVEFIFGYRLLFWLQSRERLYE